MHRRWSPRRICGCECFRTARSACWPQSRRWDGVLEKEKLAVIIARAPLRVSLAGGGTDLPVYADRFGGLVISTTINRYVYTILTETTPDVLQITAADAHAICSRRAHLFDGALFWGD